MRACACLACLSVGTHFVNRTCASYDRFNRYPPLPEIDAEVAGTAETDAAKILSEAKPLIGSEPEKAIELLTKAMSLDPRGTQCFTLLAKTHVKVSLPVVVESAWHAYACVLSERVCPGLNPECHPTWWWITT
jgi:hypothetical protein